MCFCGCFSDLYPLPWLEIVEFKVVSSLLGFFDVYIDEAVLFLLLLLYPGNCSVNLYAEGADDEVGCIFISAEKESFGEFFLVVFHILI